MDAIESRLEECMWLGGQQPSSLDAEQLQAIGSEVPSVDTHPNAFAWYSVASKFSDAVKASWPKSSESMPEAKASSKPQAAKQPKPK